MLSEFNLEEIMALARKIGQGRKLTADERDLYDDIQEDKEASYAFDTYNMFTDIMMMETGRKTDPFSLPQRQKAENRLQLTQEQVKGKIKI